MNAAHYLPLPLYKYTYEFKDFCIVAILIVYIYLLYVYFASILNIIIVQTNKIIRKKCLKNVFAINGDKPYYKLIILLPELCSGEKPGQFP